MSHKHIALIIVGLMAFLCVQCILWVRGNRDKTVAKAEAMAAEEANQKQLLAIQSGQIAQLRESSKPLTDFLAAWEAPLSAVGSSENAEAMFITRVRDANLATLSQRFDSIPTKAGTSLKGAVRAQLVFEDNYVRLLNWLGKMEEELPTLRISSIKVSKGTRPEDIRLEASLDQPIYKQ